MRSIAVVGGGFGGVGAAVMLRRAGLRRRDGVRARRARRRRLAPQHLSGRAPATSRRTCTSSRSRPTRAGRAATRRRREIQAYLEDVARRYGVLDRVRTGTEVTRARWDGDALGARDQRAAATRPTCCITACGQLSIAERARRSPASTTSTARRSTPRAGATTSTSPASAWRWSAPAAARSRSCPRSSRGRAGRRLPALARLDDPEDGLRLPRADAAAVRALPARSSGSTAQAIFAFQEFGALRR